MITVRPAGERGHANHGWLDTYHTFSFNTYHDPRHMGFRQLRVINEDFIAPGQGFGSHPHRDMEIITYVLEGALAHRDSLGNGSVITPGEVQKMSAGTGIVHSEFNHSKSDRVHLLQIWIQPAERGIAPSYEQKPLTERFGLVPVDIRQDAKLYAGRLAAGESVTHELRPGRHAWVQVARGQVSLNGLNLQAGDGAALSGEERLVMEAGADGEVLLFDLP